MFSQLRNYTDGLQYSERFENNNFAYYNDYEVRQEYEGDLTKMFYNCLRKVSPLFALFDQQYPKAQLGRNISLESLPFKTMEDLTHRIFMVFNQNNYQDTKEDLDEFKYKHNVKFFPTEFDLVKRTQGHTLANNCELSLASFQEFINFMRQEGERLSELISNLKEDYSPQQIDFYGTWFNLETLLLKRLEDIQAAVQTCKVQAVDSPIQQIPFMAFKYIVQDLLGQMTAAELWSVIVLTIPNVPWFKYMINPLTIALQGFMSREISLTRTATEEGIQNPKILFINLDGKQSPMNLRAIRSIKQNLFYITIFKEAEILQEEQSEQFRTNVGSYSKLIMSELQFGLKQTLLYERQEEIKADPNDKNFRMLGFPLNSEYLRQEYKSRNNNQDDFRGLSTSEEILFLFQHAIYNQIREYIPNAIVISYNGQLDIKQEHWNQIIRNLTIIGDHRVMLFPNLSEMCQDSADSVEVEVTPQQKFLSQYMVYNFEEINQERFLTNIAMFTKISSGAYSLQDRQVLPDQAKYSIGNKHQYFEKLVSLPYCESYQKFVAKFWKSNQLKTLMQQQTSVLLKMNTTENKQYSNLIDSAMKKIEEFDIEDEQVKVLLQRMHTQYQDDTMAELESRKNELLLQNIFETKITKVYRQMNLQKEKLREKIKVCRFKLANSENYEMRFQYITQFLFNEKEGFVIVLNYKKNDGSYIHLCGDLNSLSERGEVKLVPIPGTETLPEEPLYLAYTYCFSENNVYLIWPQEFKPLEAIINKLVYKEYNPPLVNRVCKITVDRSTYKTNFTVMSPAASKMQEQNPVVPRYGCSCWCPEANKLIYLFGGIHSDTSDLLSLPETITRLHFVKSTYYFKRHDKSLEKDRLRAKIGYSIEPKKEGSQEVIIWGGYGRNFTNTFNLFSCISYEFNFETKLLSKFKHPMRTIRLDKPLPTNKNGKFNMIVDDKGGLKFQQRFSVGPKDKFIFQSRPKDHKTSQLGEILAFMDENYKISEFKTEHRRMYLFGFSKKLKENIYTSYWSPQLYIHDGAKSHRIEILLETLRNRNDIKLAKHIFPSEDSIISTGLYDNKLYLLAVSHVYTNSQPTLYEASIANLNDIIEKRKLIIDYKYIFTAETQLLEEKAMYFEDETIFIVGGRAGPDGIRNDFILERERQNYKLRKRQLQLKGRGAALQMPNSYLLKLDHNIFSYSALYDQQSKEWLLRLEIISADFKKSEFQQTSLRMFSIDYEKCERQRIKPNLVQPRFIKIMKYDEFSIDFLSTCLERLQQALSSRIKDLESMPPDEKECSSPEQFNEIMDGLNGALKLSKEMLLKKLYSFQKLEELGNVLKIVYKKYKNNSSSDCQDETEEEMLKQITNVISLIQKKEIEDSCLGVNGNSVSEKMSDEEDLYRFIMEDLKDNKLTKYFAIGRLGATNMDFVQVKFKKEIMICTNHKNEETMFFNLFEGIYNEFTISKTKGGQVYELEKEADSKVENYTVDAKINGINSG